MATMNRKLRQTYPLKCILGFLFLSIYGIGCAHQSLQLLSLDPVADLSEVPQKVEAYSVGEPSVEERAKIADEQNTFKKKFYAIWHQGKILSDRTSLEGFIKTYYEKKHGENLQPKDPEWLTKELENSSFEDVGKVTQNGIILHHADLRVLPSVFPAFDSPLKAGEGYPFDYLQISQLYLGEPVLISHYSKDRAWAFVETNTEAKGWVQANLVAPVSSAQVKQIESKNIVVLTEDYRPFFDWNGRYWENSRTGNVLPVAQLGVDRISVFVPAVGLKGEVNLKTIEIPRSIALTQPLEFNSLGLSFAVARFIGKPYGWGGNLGNRDCASMVKDFYALFHFLLPPLSKDQVTHGRREKLEGEDLSQRSLKIATSGVPFRTLLYKKGHIGIYAGTWNQKPILFHASWGVKTRSGEQEGRNLIAKAAFTTLEAGKELPNFDSANGSLLKNLDSLIFLP